MLFKQGLFRVTIDVDNSGEVIMRDEELIYEDIPYTMPEDPKTLKVKDEELQDLLDQQSTTGSARDSKHFLANLFGSIIGIIFIVFIVYTNLTGSGVSWFIGDWIFLNFKYIILSIVIFIGTVYLIAVIIDALSKLK